MTALEEGAVEYCFAAKCTCKGTTTYSYHPKRGGSLYRNFWKKLKAGFH